jgi:hypothetical protein
MKLNRKRLAVILVAAILTATFATRPAAQVNDRVYGESEGWTGTIRFEGEAAVDVEYDGGAWKRSIRQTWQGTLTVGQEYWDKPATGRGLEVIDNGSYFSGSSSASERKTTPLGTETTETSGSVSAAPGIFGVQWPSKDSYAINFGGTALKQGFAGIDATYTRTDGTKFTGKWDGTLLYGGGRVVGKGGPASKVIGGTFTYSLPLKNFFPRATAIKGTAKTTYTWSFSRPRPNLEVVVEPEGYDKWIPKGSRDENAPGNHLAVHARLKTKDGSPLRDQVTKFIFELVKVSNQPGVCMNFPAGGDKKKPEPDLKFHRDYNPELAIFDETGNRVKWGPRAETPTGSYTYASATVSSFDFGAYGELQVTAEMADGSRIIGHLNTDRSQTIILLPKRRPGSKIADAWKERWREKFPNIMTLPDDDDSEEDPQGSHPDKGCNHKGDGLTLYEEYRGFYIRGRHRRTDPTRKDVFIYDTTGGRSKDGIAAFHHLTGMPVHHELRPDEIGPENSVTFWSGLKGRVVVVNDNCGKDTPHLGTRYGIQIRNSNQPDSFADAVGEGVDTGDSSPPGQPRQVVIYHLARAVRSASIAHELLHCCNVSHHGNTDYQRALWRKAKNSDEIEEINLEGAELIRDVDGEEAWVDSKAGNPVAAKLVKVKWEDRNDFLTAKNLPFLPCIIYVARPHGQHSGCVDCVMRYDTAQAYEPQGDSGLRFLIPDTPPEGAELVTSGASGFGGGRLLGGDFLVPSGLCDALEDPGSATDGRALRRRYGPATHGCCRSQICVNDARHVKRQD